MNHRWARPAVLSGPGLRRTPGRGVGCAIVALVLLATGCREPTLDRTYGKRRGEPGGGSVNGTAVLAEMFRARGFQVTTWHRLSPRLDRYATIVWFPDDFQPPGIEQRRFLEGWLAGQPGRTLVYVGRDYDAAISYWRTMRERPPPAQADEILRRLGQVQAEHDTRRLRMPPQTTIPWFTLRRDVARRRVTELNGPWAEGVAGDRTEILPGAALAMPTAEERDGIPETERSLAHELQWTTLLATGQQPLVLRLTSPSWPGGQILLVANGSFLLNLPLVNREHRKLAGHLVATCGAPADVAFLESQAGGPLVLDVEPEESFPSFFAAFTVWPIGAILLQLMALGMVYCFFAGPLFGRGHDLPRDAVSDFGRHVEALGELLEKSGGQAYAESRVEEYRERVRGDAGQAPKPASQPLPRLRLPPPLPR